jgi:asparagine synthase (glutamine-hydrolysing)
MCGIAGVFCFDPARRVEPALVASMGAAMVHRGPDAAGALSRGPIGLASQRLAIIDPEGGDQPIGDADGTAWIVFNGEIYNHRELRAELEAAGHRFRTRTDTEVILHAYLRWGAGCVERLNGMFAFAIWNEREHELFLARDRLGIKPLFVRRDPETLAFASEIKAILTLPWVDAQVDEDGLADHLFSGYTIGRHTFFRGIQVVPPGHWMRVRAEGVTVREYWDVPFGGLDGEDPIEHLHALLSDCVRRELEADVPVGSCLSGGIDSSLIAALAARVRPGIGTFTIGYRRNTALFEEAPTRIVGEVVGDDLGYASATARVLGTEHHAFVLPVDDLLADLDRMIWHREKAMITLSEYGHFSLSREARRLVTVLLSGQGSDELFGGYYYWWQFRGPENTTFYPWSARTEPDRPGYPVTQTDVFDHLVTDAFARRTDYRHAQQDVFDSLLARPETHDFFNRITYLLIKTHLHEMLELEDRHSMAHSLESRVPFLDHRLVEWVVNLPSHVKVSRRQEKALLKEMIRRRVTELPSAVLDRRKSPMPPPFETEALYAAMLAELRRADLAIEAYVDRARLDALLDDFEAAPTAVVSMRHYVVFTLYTLERWHHVFLGRGSAVGAG